MKTTRYILGLFIALSILLTGCNKEEVDLKEESMNLDLKKSESKKDMCSHVDVCYKNGKIISMSINGVYAHLKNGGKLFDCDGIDLASIQTELDAIVYDNGGDISSSKDQKDAFFIWYTKNYCDSNSDNGGVEDNGGVFEEEVGSDL